MAEQECPLLPIQIPDADRKVQPTRCHQFTVGTDREGIDSAGVTDQPANVVFGLDVDQSDCGGGSVVDGSKCLAVGRYGDGKYRCRHGRLKERINSSPAGCQTLAARSSPPETNTFPDAAKATHFTGIIRLLRPVPTK